MSSVFSKQIPDSLFKNIKKSFKKAEKLRKAAGFKFKKFSLRKEDIYEIEIKVTPEEYSFYEECDWKNFDLEHVDLTSREIAYFYNDRSDILNKRFGAEKMLYDGSLIEYYEHLLPYSIDDQATSLLYYKPPEISIPNNNIESLLSVEQFIRKCLDISNTILVTGLYIKYFGKTYLFKPSYFSVNASDNLKDDLYFYGPQQGSDVFCRKSSNTSVKNEIIRWSLKDSKVSKIYRYDDEDSTGIATYFYYESLKDLEKPATILKTIYFSP